MSRRWVWWLLAVIILLGAGLRLYALEKKSLWSDEVATIASAMGNSIDPDAYAFRGERFDPEAPVPAAAYREKATQSHGAGNLAATADVLRYNVHPPLFFGLMNVWIHAFGLDPGTLRLPAVLFGILCIPLMFLVARRLVPDHGDAVGLLSASLMAFSAYQVSHSQDARQYTLLVLVGLSAVWFALRLVESQRPAGRLPDWAGLVLSLAVGMYSQYFFATFVAFVYILLLWRRRNAAFLKAMALSLVALILLGLPWLPYFKDQLAFLKSVGHYTGGLWDPVKLPEKLWRIFSEFLMQESRLGRIVPLVLFGAAGLSWLNRWLEARRSGETPPAWRPELTVILLWIGVIAGGQILIDLLKDSHTATIRRYMLLASPAFYLLVAYALVKLRLPDERMWFRQDPLLVRRLLMGLTVGLVLFNALHMLIARHHSSDEYKQAAAWIAGQARPGDLLLVNKTGAIAVGMACYLPPKTPMLGVDATSSDDLMPNSPRMIRLEGLLDDYRRFWVAYSHAAPSTRKRLDDWFVAHGYTISAQERFPGVRVLLYAKPSPEPI